MILLPEIDEEEDDEKRESTRPRPSMLNRAWGLQSLANLLQKESLDTPDSSVGDMADEDPFLGQMFDVGANGEHQQPDGNGSWVSEPNYDPEHGGGETQKLLDSSGDGNDRKTVSYSGT